MGSRLKVYGRTARYARTLRMRAAMNMLAATFTVIPVTLWWTENPTSPFRISAALFASAAVTAMVFDLSRFFDRAHAGIVSEKEALDALRRSRAEVAALGARLPGRVSDLDQVALAPMVALVEVKTGRGVVRAQGDQLRCNQRTVNGASFRKMSSAGRALGDQVGAEPNLVICVVGMENDPFSSGDVTVCSERDLPEVLDAFLDANIGDPHRIARGLTARGAGVEE